MTCVSLKRIFSGTAKVKLYSLFLFVVLMASTWGHLSMRVDNGSGPVDNSSCFSATQSTVLKGVYFGGVPIVLLMNFVIFVVLLIVFTLIRRRLWDYGRLALIAETEGYGCCSWLTFIVKLDETLVQERCGVDAVHYLSFQKHLVILLLLICVLSVTIILPVNLSGDLLGNDPYSFGRTTIANLKKGDLLLWLHTVFAVLYLMITVALWEMCSGKLSIIISINKLSILMCLECIFVCREAYPTCQVTDVNLCYDVAKLIDLDRNRIRAEKNLRHYNKILEYQGRREVINPRPCSHLCCCCSQCKGCEGVDAIEYYRSQEAALREEENKQKENKELHPLGMAFVTLQNECMATYILKDFNALKCGGGARGVPQPSSKSAELRVNKWKVNYAPHPHNIYWENLSVHGWRWWLRFLLLNTALFFLLFFLTTPSIIISTIDKFNVTKPINYLNSAVISQFFPTLLLWTFSALLPTVVYYSTLGEAHWTRSSENMSMMYKLYTFLIFMVLILPSLGLTSLDVFFRWLFDKQSVRQLRFECVFLPDQGAFFVNYVIAAALVGSAMELLRLPGLLLYIVRLAVAHSAAERKYVKQNQAYEFEYGAMYGWTLCVFTVIMAYSITCPVIVPFGLLYLLLKHLVDKHNLYFAYLPARLDRQVHLGAVNQALAAPIICLMWLYFFSVIRTGFMTATSLFTLVVLCVTIFICISYTCFGHFKYLSPHNYNVSCFVLSEFYPNLQYASSESEECSIRHTYGTTGTSPPFLRTEEDCPDLEI
uniref:Transmembrane protein 63A n=1 Tax=Cyprinus carpio TaxID=7962 RepID=A0A8C2CRV8_CYPCA